MADLKATGSWRFHRRWIWWMLGAAAAAAAAWSFAPRPVSVEVTRVSRGPMQVTLDEDGRTRVRERYTVSAPVSGYLARVAHRPGAPIAAGTVVARILPALPVPIDARNRAQLDARVQTALDLLRQAHVRVDGARASLVQTTREVDRLRQLAVERVVAPQELELAQMRRQIAEADLGAAVAGVDVAQHEVAAARAALLAVGEVATSGRSTDVRSPRAGVILRVFEESERAVQAGTPLVEIGEPGALEIVADFLSTEAVQIRAGAPVLIDRWGGEGVLGGRVRLVEPSSFTKVSALGVEEQRVNVIVDFIDPPERLQRLGDGFALDVRVAVWSSESALKVPANTLFRRGDAWSVYIVANGRASERRIRIGHRNDLDAAIESGVADGDVVIVHPGDRVADGVRVAVR